MLILRFELAEEGVGEGEARADKEEGISTVRGEFGKNDLEVAKEL